jgi:hypothetical protein
MRSFRHIQHGIFEIRGCRNPIGQRNWPELAPVFELPFPLMRVRGFLSMFLAALQRYALAAFSEMEGASSRPKLKKL